MWMKVDLKSGGNWVGMPGIIYDHNDAVIDTASDFAAYINNLSLSIVSLVWLNQCTQSTESYSEVFSGYWTGNNFNIFPGQGLEMQASSDTILPIKFGQGYKRHLVCNDGSNDFYYEWSGQEEFDSLEG